MPLLPGAGLPGGRASFNGTPVHSLLALCSSCSPTVLRPELKERSELRLRLARLRWELLLRLELLLRWERERLERERLLPERWERERDRPVWLLSTGMLLA